MRSAAPSPWTGTGHSRIGRGEAAGDGRHDVVQHRAAGRRDNADAGRQPWQGSFPRRVEQALGGQALAQEFDPGEHRTGACIFQPVDNELVFRAVAIGRDLAGRDHLDPVFRFQADAEQGRFPDHRADFAALVLQAEIGVSAAVEF